MSRKYPGSLKGNDGNYYVPVLKENIDYETVALQDGESIESPSFMGNVTDLATGIDGSIYVLGYPSPIQKLNPVTLQVEAESSSLPNNAYSLCVGKNGNIYTASDDVASYFTLHCLDNTTLDNIHTIKYNASGASGTKVQSTTVGHDGLIYYGHNRTFRRKEDHSSHQHSVGPIYTTIQYGAIYALATGIDGNIFEGGYSTTCTVRKLNHVDMSNIISESAGYGGTILAITIGLDGSVYVGGLNTQTVRKLDPDTLNLVAESSNYGGAIRSLTTGIDGSIYAGGASQTVWKLNPDTLAVEAESNSHGATINASITGLDGDIYAGGYTKRTVEKMFVRSLVRGIYSIVGYRKL